jgi:hypothetical protein
MVGVQFHHDITDIGCSLFVLDYFDQVNHNLQESVRYGAFRERGSHATAQ